MTIERMLKTSTVFPGTIIDVETTGLSPSTGELITFGFFYGGVATVLQRTDETRVGRIDFENIVAKKLASLPKPFYAYNAGFEQAWLQTSFEVDLLQRYKEICEKSSRPGFLWCPKHNWLNASDALEGEAASVCPKCSSRLWNRIKWPKLNEVAKNPLSYYGAEKEINGSEVPRCWQAFVETRDKLLLEKIIVHNQSDLLKEASLLLWQGEEKRF